MVDIHLLKAMFGCSQASLKSSVEQFIEETYGQENTIIKDEYIIGLGEIPIGLVSHLDTVHSTPAFTVYHDKDENVMWSPMGLGADDRAGVYAIIDIIKKGYKPTVIFTTDEEVGGVGASALAKDYPDRPTDLKFLIELDRRGSEDCVFYDCDNTEFEKYIEDFGFKTDIGSFSDICFIAPNWDLAAVNLSIGYYNEHSVSEHLKLNEMVNTIQKVCSILDDADSAEYFEHVPRKSYGADWWKGSMETAYPGDDTELCWGCMGTFPVNEIVQSEGGEFYCLDCYEKFIKYCDICGSEYSLQNSLYLTEANICPSCAKTFYSEDN